MCRFKKECCYATASHSKSWVRKRHDFFPDVHCPLSSSLRRYHFEKNDRLYHQGDSTKGVFTLTSGLVALERVGLEGETVILRILHPGAFFSVSDLFADATYSATARAVTSVEACFIPAEDVQAALAQPDLRKEILQALALYSKEDEDSIFRLCSSDLSSRLMAVLVDLADSEGADLDGPVSLQMPVTWQDVSSMVGSSPEVISRTLRKLRLSGRIEMRGRQVTIYPQADRTGLMN